MLRQFEETSYNYLKNAIDATSLKNKVIANNIANINTKNYTRKDIDFQNLLNKEIEKNQMKITNNKHITLNNNDINIYEDTSGSYKTDGNNVDLDQEKIEQATYSLTYNTLVTKIKGKLNTTSYIISGGGN